MAEQQKRHVAVLCKIYAAPHTHPHRGNILQHTPCGEKGHHHTETDAEKQCKHQTQRPPNADMWQIKNTPIPKRKDPPLIGIGR